MKTSERRTIREVMVHYNGFQRLIGIYKHDKEQVAMVPVMYRNRKQVLVTHRYFYEVVGPNTGDKYNTSYCYTEQEAMYKFNELLSKDEVVQKTAKPLKY